MQLHQLRYFVAVADKGSFSKGALRVGVAQSAVSLQIRRLEQALGVELFQRTTRGAELTPAGRRLLGYATTILEQVALAESMVFKRDTRKIAIRLGVPSGIAQLLSVPLLKDIQDALPGIELKIVEALSGDLQDQLADGRLEMALLFRIREEDAEPTEGKGGESVYLVQSSRGRARLDTPIRLADLADVPLTMPTGRHQIRNFLTEQAARCGIALNVQAELDGSARILQLVTSGKASAVMLGSSFLREWHSGRVSARLIEDFSVEPVVVVGTRKQIVGARAIEAARRRVEALACSVSSESAKLSSKYLEEE